MALIGKIREKSWLLVAIIGIALVAFVLGDYLRESNGPESQYGYGTLYGEKVDINQYEDDVSSAQANADRTAQQQGQQKGQQVDRDQIWKLFSEQAILDKEFQSLGIDVSENELDAYLYGKDGFNVLPEFMQSFTDSITGMFNENLLRSRIEEMQNSDDASIQQQWKDSETYYINKRKQDKYFAILSQGMYVTDIEAKNDYDAKQTKKSISYVVQRYSSIKDDEVEVSDASLKSFYEEHKNDVKYKNSVATRGVNYFDITIKPSSADSAVFIANMDELKTKFAAATDDSIFISNKANSEFNYFSNSHQFTYGTDDDEKAQKRGLTYPKAMDSLFKASSIGDIVGPYNDRGTTRLAKVVDFNRDLLSVRHILISAQRGDSTQEAIGQRKVDSLMPLINASNFEEYVTKFSTDQPSIVNGGKYEDFLDFEMVPEFSDFAKSNSVGKIGYVQTQFGYHIMEVLKKDIANAPILAIVQQTLTASQETIDAADEEVDNMIYLLDDELMKLGSAEEKVAMFDTLVRKNGYFSRPLSIQENSPKVNGFETSFAEDKILKLAFNANAEVGDLITSPIKEKNRYIIAVLSSIKTIGASTFADVKSKMEREYIQEEKAKRIEKQMMGTTSLNDLTAKIKGVSVQKSEVTFSTPSIGGVNDLLVAGSIFSGLKDGDISLPIKGQFGVYVVKVEKTTPAPTATTYVTEKMAMQSALKSSLQGKATQSLVKLADVVDNRKFFTKNIRR